MNEELPMQEVTAQNSATVGNSASSRGAFWTGRVLSGLVVAFLLVDAGMKLMNLPIVAKSGEELGWHGNSAVPLGIILLTCTVLYIIPRTSIFGAVLLTGYLCGAVATHVRIDNPLFTHVLFGVYLGVMVWAGLWLRDPNLRNLFPFKRT